MAGSLTDIFAAMQNGVVALGNLRRQLLGSFNNISGQLTATSAAIAANTAAITALQALPPAFNAIKSSDQTGIADATFTPVTWQTEIYDVGNYFTSSNGWVPPAGKIHLDAAILVAGAFPVGNQIAAAIYKNGVSFAQVNNGAGGFGGNSAAVSVNDAANGTDAYTVQVFADVSSGTATIVGNPTSAFFGGFWVSS